MKGTISVESEEGKGSLFCVTIPFKKAPHPSQNRDNRAQQSGEEKTTLGFQLTSQQDYLKLVSDNEKVATSGEDSTTEKRILVADDNPINRKVILSLLKKLGHSADVACDGVELLERFNIQQHYMVLTDMVRNVNLSCSSLSDRICPV